MGEPVDQDRLKEGLRGALSLYLAETDLAHAVGESGILRIHAEIFLEHGHAQWSKGGVSFERRISLSGGRR